MQHEREPLGWSQRLEYYEHRAADRVDQEGLFGRVYAGDAVGRWDDIGADRLFAAARTGAQHVQADP